MCYNKSVKNISGDAFRGRSKKLTIYGKAGSYADQYATDKKIRFELISAFVKSDSKIKNQEEKRSLIKEKKPHYSQGEYIIRHRSTTNTPGKYTPWVYCPTVYDDLELAQFEVERFEVPNTAQEHIVEVLDFDGNIVGGAVYSY